jgi:dTDP-4-amino-4,6-dideoxygalactose transaminase
VAAGVKSGCDVVLPSFTFVATAEAVVLAGGRPVFADIDPETYNLAPAEVEKAISWKTKAVVPVDLYGLSADMKPICEIAVEHGLSVVEDAAQAHGLAYEGKPPGAFAGAACWSLYASKNMTTGEGGVVTTNDDAVADVVKMVRTHGEKAKYTSQMLGCNYRMPEIAAAIGLVQLEKLPEFLAKRRANAKRLTEFLEQTDKLRLPKEPDGCQHSWYLYTVRLVNGTESKRNKIVEKLRAKGIGAEAYYEHPLHQMPYYCDNYGRRSLPETEKAAAQVFSLPIHPSVTEEQIEYIGKTLLKLL